MPGIQVGSGRGLSWSDLPERPDHAHVGRVSFWMGSIGGQLAQNNPDNEKCQEAAQSIIATASVLDRTFGSDEIPGKTDACMVVITLEVMRENVMTKDAEAQELYGESLAIVRDWFVKVADRYGQTS